MACCALAAFLVGQIIYGLDWLSERLGLGGPRLASNATVTWRLGMATPVDGGGASRGWAAPRRIGLAVLAGVGAFAGLAALLPEASSHPALPLAGICTAEGLNPGVRPGDPINIGSRQGDEPLHPGHHS